jgi:hypothetical protein
MIVGTNRAKFWAQTDREINILMVQANIGNLERLYAEKGVGFQQEIIDRNTRLTEEGLAQSPQAQMVLWPESAFPASLNEYLRGSNYQSQLFQFVQKLKRPLMTGAFSKDPPDKLPRNQKNLALIWGEKLKSRKPGMLFFSWILAHGFGRVMMEYFRDDFRGPSILNLSISTWTSLVLICAGTGYFLSSRIIEKK